MSSNLACFEDFYLLFQIIYRANVISVEGEVTSANDTGDSGNPTIHTFTHAVTTGADDAKRKILTTFNQLKSRTTSQTSSRIFKTKMVDQ